MATTRSKKRPPASPEQSARSRRSWLVRGGVLGLVLVLSTGAWLFWERKEIARAGKEAIELAQQGRFTEAEPKLRAALEQDPNNRELLRSLALGLLNSPKHLDEADLLLTRWMRTQPAEAAPFRFRMDLRQRRAQQLGSGAEQQQLQELALADGKRVLELDPNDDATAQKVVWLCLGIGRFEDAERVCRRFRERRPDDPWLLYLQARACHALSAGTEAQGLLDRLLSLSPQFMPALLLRAVLHYEADEADRAIPLLRKVIAEDSGTAQEARYHLSLALARAGQTDEARKVMAQFQRDRFEFDTAQPGYPDPPAVRVRRAELLFDAGQDDKALAELNAVLREDTEFPSAHRLLAAYYSKRGDRAKAAEHQRRAER